MAICTKLNQILRTNMAACALLIFLFSNVLLFAFNPLSSADAENLPAKHGWAWWATRDFLKQPMPADVVLMGSSLLMNSLSRCDADYVGRALDYVDNHRSPYLEAELNKCLAARPWQCFNFALPGGIMSDNYMIWRALLRNERKPRLIVLTLSVRDLMDHQVSCAYASAHFRYLSRFTNIDDLVGLSTPQLRHQLDYWLRKGLYLLNKKLDCQVVLEAKARQLLLPVANLFCTKSLFNAVDLSCFVPSFLSEIERGVWVTHPNTPDFYLDNSPEYRKRYRTANSELFENQMKWLQKLLYETTQDGVPVLIVNMPLTKANLALMPPGLYQRHIGELTKTSQTNGVVFLDLNADPSFVESDFSDTCHMDASGGKKMADAIVSAIKANQRLQPNQLATRKPITAM